MLVGGTIFHEARITRRCGGDGFLSLSNDTGSWDDDTGSWDEWLGRVTSWYRRWYRSASQCRQCIARVVMHGHRVAGRPEGCTDHVYILYIWLVLLRT